MFTEQRAKNVPFSLKPLGSNVENGFGVIFLHANEIIMSALSAYQKQAFISDSCREFCKSLINM